MNKKHEILDELRTISPVLAETVVPVPYHVPEGYFETFPAAVMERLAETAGLPETHAMRYSVPEGYFESLAGNILERIREQENAVNEVQAELEEVAPLLNSISKANIYAVPEGYFDTISFMPEKQPAKLIRLKLGRRWTQYAAAAILAGILIMGGFLYTGNNNNKTDYNTYSRMDIPAELDKVTDADLAVYLNNPETPDTDVLADVRHGINSMSDEELNQYLSDNQDMDMIIPVSN